MIGPRTDFTFTAVVVTPMHIGTGADEAVDGISKDRGAVQVAQVATDFEGFPIIPGSGLKGVLAGLLGRDLELFGGEDEPDKLVGGRVIFWNGDMDRASVQQNGPHHDKPLRSGANELHADKSLFIETNAAIDPATGVVKTGRLFHKQMVAPGTRFNLSLSTQDDINKEKVARLLAVLCSEHGLGLGKGTKSNQGRLSVDLASLEATTLEVGGKQTDTSTLWRKRIAAVSPDVATRLGKLTLKGEGPYIILDPSVERDAADQNSPHLSARTGWNGDPWLSGTGLIGVLRGEFSAWLSKSGRDGSDNKDAIYTSRKNLTLVQRIFGVTGWKGMVSVLDISSIEKSYKEAITSVRIDRFSGANIDGALFATEAWINPEFEVSLAFDSKRASPEDLALFKAFLDALEDPIWGGLRLGYGTNKGYGWFAATFEEVGS